MAAESRVGARFVVVAVFGILAIVALLLVGLGSEFLSPREPGPPEVVVISSPTLLPTYTPAVVAQATPIPTLVVQPTAALPGSSPRELPETGFGPLESAAAGLVLVLVMALARRGRTRTG